MAAKKKETIKDRIECWITPDWRFQKRSGATTMAEHNARKALFHRLVEMGQLDTIEDLQQKLVSWEELRQRDRLKQLGNDQLSADIKLSKRLWTSDDAAEDEGVFATILPTLATPGPEGHQSRLRFAVVFRQLRRYGAAAGFTSKTTVKDLAKINWPKLWAEMGELSASSRNGVRLTVSLFLSSYLGKGGKKGGKRHAFRHTVCEAMGEKEGKRAKPKPMSPAQYLQFQNALEDAMQPIAFVLATSGIRIAEYLQLGEEQIAHLPTIIVPGYDDTAAIADDPVSMALARQAIPCPLPGGPEYKAGHYPGVNRDWRYTLIRREFARASKVIGFPRTITPHSLRHFYTQTALSSKHGKQSTLQVMHALRHASQEMTGLYARHGNAQDVSNAVGGVIVSMLASQQDEVQACARVTPAEHFEPYRWLRDQSG